MLLVIDNYDSFTYNLVQYFQMLGETVRVCAHDAITVSEIAALKPQYIVISPGPGHPNQAGISLAVIDAFKGLIPILGVCLGHQCIGQYFGGTIVQAQRIMHGKTSLITHEGRGLFQDLEQPLRVTRYHSLVIDPQSLPPVLSVDAKTDEGEIMAVSHRTLSLYGVQFHPESILSEQGLALLKNFLRVP
jgi:anthranilate synthase/aminodeoxychorismate synthase-like glutamine amidotransferase